jgi:hypothetical protein
MMRFTHITQATVITTIAIVLAICAGVLVVQAKTKENSQNEKSGSGFQQAKKSIFEQYNEHLGNGKKLGITERASDFANLMLTGTATPLVMSKITLLNAYFTDIESKQKKIERRNSLLNATTTEKNKKQKVNKKHSDEISKKAETVTADTAFILNILDATSSQAVMEIRNSYYTSAGFHFAKQKKQDVAKKVQTFTTRYDFNKKVDTATSTQEIITEVPTADATTTLTVTPATTTVETVSVVEEATTTETEATVTPSVEPVTEVQPEVITQTNE